MINSVSKVLERIAYDQIVSFLDEYELLNPCQHGFRKYKSTETALCTYMQEVYSNVDENKYVVGLFFDLYKAFDSVDINILCQKLSCMGFRGLPLNWIHDYLSSRKIVVRINDTISTEDGPLHIGVPQGSVLGPLLFLILINDLPKVMTQGTTMLFADDTSVLVSATTPEELEEKIKTTVSEMSKWCVNNRLILNVDKTEFIFFP